VRLLECAIAEGHFVCQSVYLSVTLVIHAQRVQYIAKLFAPYYRAMFYM